MLNSFLDLGVCTCLLQLGHILRVDADIGDRVNNLGKDREFWDQDTQEMVLQ